MTAAQWIVEAEGWETKLATARTDADAAGGKPDNPSGVAHMAYVDQCRKMAEWCRAQAALVDGPVEQTTLGYSS
jgi:hypothetical protein